MSTPPAKDHNPFSALLAAPTPIRTAYTTHRTARQEQQTARLLSSPSVQLDPNLPVLPSLASPSDARHSLVLWARPSLGIKSLIGRVQAQLRALAPRSIWLAPADALHMTVMEVVHSVGADEVAVAVSALTAPGPVRLRSVGAVLDAPRVSFDAGGVALGFLPADGAYHALRAEVWDACARRGLRVRSRYMFPSAHVTIARWATGEDLDGAEKMRAWMGGVEQVNRGLEEETDGVTWEVRELVWRRGKLWYGGGETVEF